MSALAPRVPPALRAATRWACAALVLPVAMAVALGANPGRAAPEGAAPRVVAADGATADRAAADPTGGGDLPAVPEDPEALRSWVEAIRASPRGPFQRIRWFCADGSVLPPRPGACADRGGGVQHGEWSDRVRALRRAGYRVATVLADLDGGEFTGPDADLAWLRQLLVERFLVEADQGWIFHGARSYRGALQAEDERAGARRVVRGMLADPAWRDPVRWLLLRETVRLLPRSSDAVTAARVRHLATEIAQRDPGFEPLRAKIHNLPDAGDAQRVREHAAARGREGAADRYARLAAGLDALYAARSAPEQLRVLADRLVSGGFGAGSSAPGAPGSAAGVPAATSAATPSGSPALFAATPSESPALFAAAAGAAPGGIAPAPGALAATAATLRRHARRLEDAGSPAARLAAAAELLAFYRERLTELGGSGSPASDRALVEASLALEDEAYAAAGALGTQLGEASRRVRLEWLRAGAQALYGAGFLSRRHLDAVGASLARLEAAGGPRVSVYRRELRYLARGPEWAGRWLDFHLGRAVERLAALDPRARLYPQERLRSSPLLFYSRVVDGLVADANRQAGIRHRVFETTPGAGVRGLNPGLARGVLREVPPGGPVEGLRRDGLYLLDATVAELPPVAGILTRGEGSSLSHVQLLARNLGIPNVVVGEAVLPAVRAHLAGRAVLAVSPAGVVQLVRDGPAWDPVFGSTQTAEGDGGEEPGPAGRGGDDLIRPDLEKLDLATARLVPLSELRADDSGRIVGPKSANLGELAHHFGDAVPEGFVIPFGVFRDLLEQPLSSGGPSVWKWMQARYTALERMEGEAREEATRAFLARLREWIVGLELGPELRDALVLALRRTFGPDGSYGVFVRSDTNVEDLPGFTGAGLNLTVPNVVGEEKVLEAVKRVWASPFTERAYAWRQDRMERPAYVFPAVLVQRAVPADASGVLVTVDVDTGSPEWLTVAANEGVGGAVEGQAAETLRVRADGSEVRFLYRATAPLRKELAPEGGVVERPASGTDAVLGPAEIEALVELAGRAPAIFPALRREDGAPRPADLEFAFHDRRLFLLQIRPFVESRRARQSTYLRALDAGLDARGALRVDLDAVPPAPGPSRPGAAEEDS